MTENNNSRALNLTSLGPTLRSLFTGYLLVIGIGLMVAGGQILLTHGMADGEFGLSIDDIVYSYYGDRNGSVIENKLQGSMKDKAPRTVRQEIIKWVREGASQAKWESDLGGRFATHCTRCHSVIPGLPDFTTYENVLPLAKVDSGASIGSLTRVSHIHLFGIAFIFFFVGLIFSLAIGIPRWLKITAISMPFVFLVVDVLSWWLTKIHPSFAWLTLVAGFGYTLASGFMWVTSMVQMWWFPYKGKISSHQTWWD